MTLEIRDGDGLEKHLKATGAGTAGDAFVVEHLDSNSAAALTALQAIQVAAEILDNIVSGSEAQVDIITVPADPFGANADAASTAGGAGSIQAKLRLMTTQLNAIATAANQATLITALGDLLTELQGKADLGETQPVSGTVTAQGPLTDAELRATAVPISGPLTDAELRATAVPVSGTVTADGPLTDAELRATAVPTQDAGTAFTTSLGVSGAAVVSADITTTTAITDAPTAGQKIVLDDLYISTDTAMYLEIEVETSGTVLLGMHLAANTLYQLSPRGRIVVPTADKRLFADSDTAGNVAITPIYHSAAA